MATTEKFIGSGLIFPIEINEKGRPNLVSDTTLIRASILHIINWPYRTRFFNETFGCRIEECLEDPDDLVTVNLAKFFIAESISKWEKRVELSPSGVKVLQSESTIINLQLTYNLRNTKLEETFIFPFYKEITY